MRQAVASLIAAMAVASLIAAMAVASLIAAMAVASLIAAMAVASLIAAQRAQLRPRIGEKVLVSVAQHRKHVVREVSPLAKRLRPVNALRWLAPPLPLARRRSRASLQQS